MVVTWLINERYHIFDDNETFTKCSEKYCYGGRILFPLSNIKLNAVIKKKIVPSHLPVPNHPV